MAEKEGSELIDRELLIRAAASVGVAVEEEAVRRLDIYARLLTEWNEKMNLTAITDPAGIAVKHFADSLSVLPLLPAGPLSLIDVGTGAGFPGVPLAICRGDVRLTLLDSLQKRLVFLETLCRELGIDATLIHARAEEGGRDPALRESFDAATARAVAPLPALCEMCLPFVKVGGLFLALKGPDGGAEQRSAADAARILGARFLPGVALTLEGAGRYIVRAEKIAPTPKKYPRPNARKG